MVDTSYARYRQRGNKAIVDLDSAEEYIWLFWETRSNKMAREASGLLNTVQEQPHEEGLLEKVRNLLTGRGC